MYLYPISLYWEYEVREHAPFLAISGASPGKLNDLVATRYRDKGYRVVWVFFGKPSRLTQPYRANQSEWVRIHSDDKVISAGITLCQMTSQQPPVYPDSLKILESLGESVEEFIVGGFHLADCVDKLAQAAHNAGIRTWVDEDCTEAFFSSVDRIPLDWHPSQGTWWFLEELPESLRRICIENRRQKPWLAQPRIQTLP